MRALLIAAGLLVGTATITAPAAAQSSPPTPIADVSDAALVRKLPGFSEASVTVDGVRLHYVSGGKGTPVLLLPGWPQTWWGYHKIMPQLARRHRVIAVDIRGMGASDKPTGGYDKKTMAGDIAGLVRSLGLGKVAVVGHDIGSMVAYSFAANHPDLTSRVVLLDVGPPDASLAKWPLLPGVGTFGDKVGDGSHAYAWWFAYHQVPELHARLAAEGRIRIEQDWFFHYLLRDDASVDAFDRDVFAAAYGSADAIRAGDAWYQAFPQDIIENERYAPLTMPVLALGGPGYTWLASVLPEKARDVKVVRIADSGHFIPDEVPEELLRQLDGFLK